MLNPALAALTLGLVSGAALAERLGRNARFAAIGSAVGVILMGVCGTWVSTQAVFWLAALMCVPALIALQSLGKQPRSRRRRKREDRPRGGAGRVAGPPAVGVRRLHNAVHFGQRGDAAAGGCGNHQARR